MPNYDPQSGIPLSDANAQRVEWQTKLANMGGTFDGSPMSSPAVMAAQRGFNATFDPVQNTTVFYPEQIAAIPTAQKLATLQKPVGQINPVSSSFQVNPDTRQPEAIDVGKQLMAMGYNPTALGLVPSKLNAYGKAFPEAANDPHSVAAWSNPNQQAYSNGFTNDVVNNPTFQKAPDHHKPILYSLLSGGADYNKDVQSLTNSRKTITQEGLAEQRKNATAIKEAAVKGWTNSTLRVDPTTGIYEQSHEEAGPLGQGKTTVWTQVDPTHLPHVKDAYKEVTGKDAPEPIANLAALQAQIDNNPNIKPEYRRAALTQLATRLRGIAESKKVADLEAHPEDTSFLTALGHTAPEVADRLPFQAINLASYVGKGLANIPLRIYNASEAGQRNPATLFRQTTNGATLTPEQEAAIRWAARNPAPEPNTRTTSNFKTRIFN